MTQPKQRDPVAIPTGSPLAVLRDLGVGNEAAEIIERMIEQAFDGVYLLHETRYLYVNDAFCDITGYSRGELTDATFDYNVMLSSAAKSTISDRYAAHSRGETPASRYDVAAVRKGGEQIDLEVSVNRVDGVRGVLVMGVVRDVTERRTNERMLRQLVAAQTAELNAANHRLALQAEELFASNKELEQFAYVASHDLQEPLRVVMSFSELLLADESDPQSERAQWLQVCSDAAARMHAQVHGLLQMSRLQAQPIEHAEIDLEALIHGCLEDFRLVIDESGARIDVDVQCTPRADADRIRSLLANLLGNALKFRSRDRQLHIRVNAQPLGDGWELRVSDNGIGIDMQYQERIFMLFRRLHGRHEYPGTGIGLALCKKVVALHGGKLVVSSTVGEGSTFTATFPHQRKAR